MCKPPSFDNKYRSWQSERLYPDKSENSKSYPNAGTSKRATLFQTSRPIVSRPLGKMPVIEQTSLFWKKTYNVALKRHSLQRTCGKTTISCTSWRGQVFQLVQRLLEQFLVPLECAVTSQKWLYEMTNSLTNLIFLKEHQFCRLTQTSSLRHLSNSPSSQLFEKQRPT